MTRPVRQPEDSLSPDILRIVEGIALALAQEHHAIQEEADRNSTLLITARQAARVAHCLTISQFRLLVEEGIFPKPALANKRWVFGELKMAVEKVLIGLRDEYTCSEVYFAQAGDSIKIGYSRRVKRRINGLQTGSPSKLMTLHAMKGSRHNEAFIHKQLSHLRQQGEWFRKTNGLLAYIDWLKLVGPAPGS